ncbi:MAG: hypothetical protein ACKN99_03080 [Gemmatimonadota bacterium]
MTLRALARLLRTCLTRGRWATPRRVPYLLYFAHGRDLIEPLVPVGSLEACDMREDSINLRVQLACALRGRWSAIDYGDEYIRRVQPRVVMTCIDNFWQFYELKTRFPGITFITIQNGVRGPSDDVFGHLAAEDPAARPPRHVDEMLVYGPAVGRELAKYVTGRIRAVGSVRSNGLRRATSPSTPARVVTYVSTRRSTVDPDRSVAIHGGTVRVTVGEVYARRDQVVRHLAEYCHRHGL